MDLNYLFQQISRTLSAQSGALDCAVEQMLACLRETSAFESCSVEVLSCHGSQVRNRFGSDSVNPDQPVLKQEGELGGITVRVQAVVSDKRPYAAQLIEFFTAQLLLFTERDRLARANVELRAAIEHAKESLALARWTKRAISAISSQTDLTAEQAAEWLSQMSTELGLPLTAIAQQMSAALSSEGRTSTVGFSSRDQRHSRRQYDNVRVIDCFLHPRKGSSQLLDGD